MSSTNSRSKRRQSGLFVLDDPDSPIAASKENNRGTKRSMQDDLDDQELDLDLNLQSPVRSKGIIMSPLRNYNNKRSKQDTREKILEYENKEKKLPDSDDFDMPLPVPPRGRKARVQKTVLDSDKGISKQVQVKESSQQAEIQANPESLSLPVQPELTYEKFENFQRALVMSVQGTVTSLSLERVAQCFPKLQENEKGVEALEKGRIQLLDFWKRTCESQFEKIIEERDLKKKLDQLDEMVYDAKIRSLKKERHGKDKALPLKDVKAEELVANQSIAVKREINERMKKKLKKIKEENSGLLKEFSSLSNNSNQSVEKLKEYQKYLQEYLTVKKIDDSISSRKFDDLLSYVSKKYIDEKYP